MKQRSSVLLSLFALGGFTIPAQIYFLREFLAVFNGNELVIGTTLSLWLLLTGAGALLARVLPVKHGPYNFAVFLMMLLSVLPVIAIFNLPDWKAFGLHYGVAPGLPEIFIACLVALLPCCLISGYLFILLTGLLDPTDQEHAPGKAYAWESLGGLMGGVLVNFILLWYADSLSALRITFVIFLVLICIVNSSSRLSIRLSVYLSSVLLMLFIFYFPFRQLSLRSAYRDQEVILDEATPYGKVTVTQSGEQLNYYADGTLLFSSGNTMWNEESVHYALLQRDSCGNVLMAGGGISGTIPEVLKYRPVRVDYVEINPVLADLTRRYIDNTPADNVFVHRADVRSFLAGVERSYDFCLINVPEPSTLQLNRYYTLEFLKQVKSHLTHSGIVCLSLPATADYVSPDAGQMNGSLFRTMQSVFSSVAIVPGTRNWYLASDSALTLEIARLVTSPPHHLLANEFVNPWYIDDGLLADRSAYIRKNITPDAPVNRDFHPVMYRQQLSIWLDQHGMGWPVVLGAVAAAFALFLLLLNRTGAGLFAAGFTGASLEVIIILVLQVAYGFVFAMTGSVIMVFMAGLALGPWLARKLFPKPGRKHFLFLLCLLATTPLLLITLNNLSINTLTSNYALCTMHYAICLAVSLLTGMLYPLSVAISSGDPVRSASRNYSADLFGAAIGAFLVPVVFLPLAGLTTTLFLLSGLNLVAIIFFLTTKDTKLFAKGH